MAIPRAPADGHTPRILGADEFVVAAPHEVEQIVEKLRDIAARTK